VLSASRSSCLMGTAVLMPKLNYDMTSVGQPVAYLSR
jgi:hypothetical protein